MKTSKLDPIGLGSTNRIAIIAWALFGSLFVISIVVVFQNCQPKVNFNSEPARTFASACGEAQYKPFSASPEDADSDKALLCGEGNALVEPTAGGKSVALTADSKFWEWQCQGQGGSDFKAPVSCQATHSVPISAACETRLGKGGEFTRPGDVGRMIRAFYCLFLFRDPSAGLPPSSASVATPDIAGVAYWGTRFIGKNPRIGTVLELFEAVINDPSGDGTTESNDMENVNSEDKVVNRTNSWLAQFGFPVATVSKNGTWDSRRPGQYAKNLITGVYTANSALKQKMDDAFKNQLYNSENKTGLLPLIYSAFFDETTVFETKSERLGIWAGRIGAPYAGADRKFIYSIMKDMLMCPEFWNTRLPGTKSSPEAADRTIMELTARELAAYLYRLAFRVNDPPISGINSWEINSRLTLAIAKYEDAKKLYEATKDLKNLPQNTYGVKMAYANLIVDFVGGSSEFCSKVPAVCTRLNGQNQAPPDDSVHNTISLDDNGK